MNIQDLISTIINYVKNIDKKDLLLFSLVFYTLYKTKCIEKTSNTDNPLSTENLAAIRNLGNFAKQLQSGNDIVLPGNVKIEGNLNLQKGDKKFRIALDDYDSVLMQTNQNNVQFGPHLGDTDSDINSGSWNNSTGPTVRGYNLIFGKNIVAKYIKSEGNIDADGWMWCHNGIYSNNGKIHLTGATNGKPYLEAIPGNKILGNDYIKGINSSSWL